MAPTTQQYRNSDARGSGNSRPFFSREKLQKLLESLPAKQSLIDSAIAVWRECGQHEGTQFFFMKSIPDCARRRRVCERTMRTHMRKLETFFGKCSIHQDGPDPACQQCRGVALFQLHKKANTVRRPATHMLNTEALVQARRREDGCLRCGHAHLGETECGCELTSRHSYKRLCRCSESYAPNVVPISKPPQPEPAAAKSAAHRDTKKPPRQLTIGESRDLVAKVAQLQKGCHGTVRSPEGGMGRFIAQGDPDYREPMSKENALISACMTLAIPIESARAHLEQCGWRFDVLPDSS